MYHRTIGGQLKPDDRVMRVPLCSGITTPSQIQMNWRTNQAYGDNEQYEEEYRVPKKKTT